MITCKNCNKEIITRIIIGCCCGSFCSMDCMNEFHKRTNKEASKHSQKTNHHEYKLEGTDKVELSIG